MVNLPNKKIIFRRKLPVRFCGSEGLYIKGVFGLTQRGGRNDGVEPFVLDDGWFTARCNDFDGLGDWTANTARLPNGLAGMTPTQYRRADRAKQHVSLAQLRSKKEP